MVPYNRSYLRLSQGAGDLIYAVEIVAEIVVKAA